MALGADLGLRVGAWTLLFHPLLLDQIERVVSVAEREKSKLKSGGPEGPNLKLLAAMRRIILSEVPEDPSRPTYRDCGTLGEQLKHWLRAKFGNGRFRLFFRYRRDAGLIVFAWVNDAESLRTYGSSIDAYAVFRRMLGGGNPPDDWDELVAAAANPDALRRGRALFGEDHRS
jgi:toxin YhaV